MKSRARFSSLLTRAALAAVAVSSLIATAALSQETAVIGPANPHYGPTTVTLGPSADAVAEVTFDNRNVNSGKDNGSYPLTALGLTVEVVFHWSTSADAIEVIAPPGYYAAPPVLELAEGTVGRVLIFSGEWEGM